MSQPHAKASRRALQAEETVRSEALRGKGLVTFKKLSLGPGPVNWREHDGS